MNPSACDKAAGHRHFSATCFNKAWEYIDKLERTEEENEKMLLSSAASLWHWMQRDDCGPLQLSIGYWQLSRVCVLAGRPDSAIRYGHLSLRHSAGLPPFYEAYAHEALARALAGNDGSLCGAAIPHLARARELLPFIEEPGERALLEADLKTIPGAGQITS
jgi:hypothetical protein